MNLVELIVERARSAAAEQRSDGSMQPGHNGPYNDSETPTRNTGHWLIAFCAAHELSGDERFADAARSAVGYLRGNAPRSGKGSFLHRDTRSKDRCNGLIGQAWTIEALTVAAAHFGDDELSVLAADVFLRHVFDAHQGLWKRLDPDGRALGFDGTVNHQLWFAAAGGEIRGPGSELIARRLERFLDALPNNLTVLPSGLVYHSIDRPLTPRARARYWGEKALRRIPGIRTRQRRRDQASRSRILSKSIGYHAFCTYALGLLRRRYPTHECWTSGALRKVTRYLNSEEYKVAVVREMRYGFPYNAPGFEVPVSLFLLSALEGEELIETSQWWIDQQVRLTYDCISAGFTRNTPDPLTLNARLYELTRLPAKYLQRLAVDVSI